MVAEKFNVGVLLEVRVTVEDVWMARSKKDSFDIWHFDLPQVATSMLQREWKYLK